MVKIQDISRLVGNTKMLKIFYKYKKEERSLYAKLETSNFTGSIKDRIALHILKKAYKEKKIEKNYTIIEATSGNTGISFAAIGKALGHKVEIFIPDWVSKERFKLLKSYGAIVHLISKKDGGFLEAIRQAYEKTVKFDNVFSPKQFDNMENIEAHYASTAPEIFKTLSNNKISIDAFVSGVGTGGTIMGINNYAKDHKSSAEIDAIDLLSSPILSSNGKKKGFHRIQGISDAFIPSIVDLTVFKKIIIIDDGDAIIMAQNLAKNLGLGVGISSGAHFIGAIQVQNILGKNAKIVTTFCDDNKKYLTTDLMKKEPIKDDFLSKEISLIGWSVLM
jgi:cysteine synthase